jgi:amino acid transporter
MHEVAPGPATEPAHLSRRFGLLQATALNMSNMVGVGPFLTIPLLLSAMNGPQAMLGWVVAFAITFADAMVWSELGAALPGSGGSYVYLREGYGRHTFGRLMAFLFIWQFIFSGPLEIASGYIGFAQYFGYIHQFGPWGQFLVAAAVGVVNIVLLYRQITSIGRITVGLWVGTLLTILAVLATGVTHFDPKLAFDLPSGAFRFSLGFLLGLGSAARIGIYDYLGYYDVCYIGEEVKNPGRTIPRSILISLTAIGLVYFALNLSLIGVIPWRSFVPAEQHPEAKFVFSKMMEIVYGPGVAVAFTGLVLWTTFGSVFALLLGYSRIPYAAAQDGCFFKIFGRLHPTKNFPHISLLAIGLIAIACCTLSLGEVIDALITTRLLVQFIGQIFAVILLRRNQPDLPRPYRIWLYPLPNLAALAGWIFVFFTSGTQPITWGLGMLVLGILVFFAWSCWTRQWPFAPQPE